MYYYSKLYKKAFVAGAQMKGFLYELYRHRSSEIKNETFEIDVQSLKDWNYWTPLAISSERTRRFTITWITWIEDIFVNIKRIKLTDGILYYFRFLVSASPPFRYFQEFRKSRAHTDFMLQGWSFIEFTPVCQREILKNKLFLKSCDSNAYCQVNPLLYVVVVFMKI